MELKNIINALIKFHSEVGKVAKNSTNPYFKSKYGDLNAYLEVIKKPLQDCGLVLVQMPITNGLKTMLMHDRGEYLESECYIPELTNDPQKLGAVITYLRRYSIASMLMLNAEDTDANDTGGAKYNGAKQQALDLYKRIKNPNEKMKEWIAQIDTHTDKEVYAGLTKLKGMLPDKE